MVLGGGFVQKIGGFLGLHRVLALVVGTYLLVVELRKARWVSEHVRHRLRGEVG